MKKSFKALKRIIPAAAAAVLLVVTAVTGYFAYQGYDTKFISTVRLNPRI